MADGTGHKDPLATALESAADHAATAAKTQRQVAETARAAARDRRAGRDVDDRIRAVLELLGASAGQLVQAAGGIRRSWVRVLSAEGQPIRRIGETLGVSHQRVHALLNAARSQRSDGP